MNDEYVSFSAAWFTLSLINAGLAQAKGRSGLNWWLASIFIGPFATLLIVAWPRGGTGPDPGDSAANRRSGSEAIVLGGVILGVLLLVIGLLALAGGR